MKHAFISYASDDLPIVEKICAHLERRGIDCWMAPRDIIPGKDYAEAIIAGIEGAATTLLLLSERSNQSMFVKREIERAVSKAKPVIPVRIQSVMPSASLEFFVSSAHWIDVWQEPLDPKMDLLASAIRKLTGENSRKFEIPVSAEAGESHPPRDLALVHAASPTAPSCCPENKDAVRDDAIVSQRDDLRKGIKGRVSSPLKWSIVVAGITLLVVGYALLNHAPESMDRASNPTSDAMPTEADASIAGQKNSKPSQLAGETRAPAQIGVEPTNDSARTTGVSQAESRVTVATRKTAEPDRREDVVVRAEDVNAANGKVPPTQAARSDDRCKLILSKASLGVEPLNPDESNYLQLHCR